MQLNALVCHLNINQKQGMKKLFFLFFSLMLAGILNAQPKAAEGRSDFQKTLQPDVRITVPYPDDVIDKAIEDYMAKKGIRPGSVNGFKVYRNYKLEGQDHNSDLYFKVDRKSRSEKDVSIVYLMLAKTAEDIKSRKLNDSTGLQLEGGKELLEGMLASFEAYNLEVQIKNQEAAVKKAQKKFDDLVSDQKDYEKKMRNIQDKQTQNKKDQVRQSEEIKKYINGDDKLMAKAEKKLRNLTDDEADYDKSLKNTMDKLEQNKRDQQAQQDEVKKQKDILDTLTAKRK